jgi:teichuronic acid biosynthesis glycosyltransferase TuaC
MKILFLTGELKNEIGMSPFIFSQGESLKRENNEVDYLILKGFSFTKYILGIFQMKKYLKNREYDIIHSHYSYCGFTATFQKKIPVVVSFMGSDVLEEFGYLRKIIEKIVLTRVYAKIKYCICKSKEIQNKLTGNLISEVIPNGVNFDKFFPVNKEEARQRLGLLKDKKYILFASNPERKEKNYSLAVEAVRLTGNPDIILLPVHGLTQNKLNLYYSASDLLLLTSLFEGSPNVIKEAFVCNLPVVSTDVGDVSEILKYSGNSFITSFDGTDIAEKIITVLKSGDAQNDDLFVESLNEKHTAKRIIDFYQRILN